MYIHSSSRTPSRPLTYVLYICQRHHPRRRVEVRPPTALAPENVCCCVLGPDATAASLYSIDTATPSDIKGSPLSVTVTVAAAEFNSLSSHTVADTSSCPHAQRDARWCEPGPWRGAPAVVRRRVCDEPALTCYVLTYFDEMLVGSAA